MKYVISAIGFGLIILRIWCPDLKIDGTAIGLFVFSSIILLIKDPNEFFSRITEFKLLGSEFKLSQKTQKLIINAEKIEERSTKKSQLDNLPKDFISGLAEKISKPKAALMFVAIEIEKTLELLQNQETSNDHPVASSTQIEHLRSKGVIDYETEQLFMEFWSVRNSVIHGKDKQISDDTILEVVDLGTKILKILNSLRK